MLNASISIIHFADDAMSPAAPLCGCCETWCRYEMLLGLGGGGQSRPSTSLTRDVTEVALRAVTGLTSTVLALFG